MMRSGAPLGGKVDALVIGASAGGVEALSTLLPAITPAMGIAVIVVLHLPPARDSLLVDLFAPRCALAVAEAEDKVPIEPGCLYFAPPNYHLLVDTGPRLALSVDEAVNYSRPSIDVLFESAAQIYGERLLGLLLTGANDDGARGLQAIRAAGGVTIAQDPDEAHCAYMPQAAIARGAVQHVLDLASTVGLLKTLEPTP